jgi:hypothetical protein
MERKLGGFLRDQGIAAHSPDAPGQFSVEPLAKYMNR